MQPDKNKLAKINKINDLVIIFIVLPPFFFNQIIAQDPLYLSNKY